MKRFVIEIGCLGNAAFNGRMEEEVARILREIADRIEAGRTSGKAIDINGIIVGTFELKKGGK